MYVKREVAPHIIWFFSRTMVLATLVYSCVLYALYQVPNLALPTIPFLPIATVGTAVAFYIGFKNNASYDRCWEARKIWGELTNVSRALSAYIISVSGAANQSLARDVVYRLIAYVNVLRLQLRRNNVWDSNHDYTQMSEEWFKSEKTTDTVESVISRFCPDDSPALEGRRNVAKQIVLLTMQRLSDARRDESLTEFQHSDLMRLCSELFTLQGKAERIKNFPFPRQYAFFSELFVYIFVILLPLGLIGEFQKLGIAWSWLAVPFSVLISWVFYTMEKVGDTSENPFEGSLNDTPMSAICRNIEIDLREMLGEQDLPDALRPQNNILM